MDKDSILNIILRESKFECILEVNQYVDNLLKEPRVKKRIENIGLNFSDKTDVEVWLYKRGENGLRLADIHASTDKVMIVSFINRYVEAKGIPKFLNNEISIPIFLEDALIDALIKINGGTNFNTIFGDDFIYYDKDTYNICEKYIENELITFINFLEKKGLSIKFAEEFFVKELYNCWEEKKSQKADDEIEMLDRKLGYFEKNNSRAISIFEVDEMTGIEFEDFIYNAFFNKSYIIEKTTTTGDQGVDLIFYDKDNRKGVVQCKRYSGNVGNTAVQEIISGANYYDANMAIVITNSFFTKQAIDLAEKTGIILWDREDVIDILLS